MAVTIPSDLVLDVLRSATPSRASAARAQLVAADAGSAKPGMLFDNVLSRISPATMSGQTSTASANSAVETGTSINGGNFSMPSSPQKAFEQMVLRNLFESMLPAADSGIYGDEGASSGVWRSLEAEQLATAYTKAGGLGIAGSLGLRSQDSEPVNYGQWPYFEQSAIAGFAA